MGEMIESKCDRLIVEMIETKCDRSMVEIVESKCDRAHQKLFSQLRYSVNRD